MKLWIAMLVVSLSVVGCGQKTAETIVEVAMEAAAKADGQNVEVDIDADSGTMTIVTADGEVSYKATGDDNSMEVQTPEGSMVVGDKAKVPEDYPKDVPLPEGFKPQMVSSMDAQGAYVMSGMTSESVEEIAALYAEKAPKEGWTQSMSVTQPQMTMVAYEKDGRTFQVTAALDRKGKTGLSITTMAKRK